MKVFIDTHLRWWGLGVIFDRFNGLKNLRPITMVRFDVGPLSLVLYNKVRV
jgi:hypothetical protein